MALIRIPPVLRPQTGGEPAVEVAGRTVGEVLRGMCILHPDTRSQLFDDEGGLNRYVNVYLNDEDIRVLDGLETPAVDQDTIVILPAMAGPVRDREEDEESADPWLSEASDSELVAEIDVRVQAVSDALINRLAAEPSLMHRLNPRQFEELMAELYAREGFEVELTPPTRDGGVDLYLVRYTSFGRLLTIVEAKRHRADRTVGVGIVRQLYGVLEEKRANAGVVATTSFFSPAAKSFQKKIGLRLALQDYSDLREMLRNATSPTDGSELAD